MKTSYLFPNHYKKLGWIVFIPSAILGLFTVIYEYEPNILNIKVPAIFVDAISDKNQLIGLTENNFLNEILGILVIISLLLIAFSKEKNEDEYISKIRLESLVWSVFFNYGILIIALLFIYDFNFYWVMIFNMFTILIYFIVRFNWQLSKIKNSTPNEE